MRLFFSLWPDEAVRRALALRARAVAVKTGGRESRAITLHLTLAFLGEVADSRLNELLAIGRTLRGTAFDLQIDYAHRFQRAKVAWLGATQPPAALLDLQSHLRESLTACQFTLEPGPFRPHVTVARKIEQPIEHFPVSPVVWPVKSFCLVRSHLDEEKPRYELLESWPLSR
jgi:2'-5' RNA ligase